MIDCTAGLAAAPALHLPHPHHVLRQVGPHVFVSGSNFLATAYEKAWVRFPFVGSGSDLFSVRVGSGYLLSVSEGERISHIGKITQPHQQCNCDAKVSD